MICAETAAYSDLFLNEPLFFFVEQGMIVNILERKNMIFGSVNIL